MATVPMRCQHVGRFTPGGVIVGDMDGIGTVLVEFLQRLVVMFVRVCDLIVSFVLNIIHSLVAL